MLMPPLLVEAPDFRPSRALAEALLTVDDYDVAAVMIPALWGADELLGELAGRTRVHRLRHDATSGESLASALGPPGVENDAGAVGFIVVQHPAELEERRFSELLEFVSGRPLTVLLILRSQQDLPETVIRHGRTGRVVTLAVRALTPEDTVRAMVRELGGPVTSLAARRTVLLSGGHPQAVNMVLERARRTQVLRPVDGVWRWEPEEPAFRRRLAEELPELMRGLEEKEHELLRLISCAWRLPESWAVREFGVCVVDSLRAQGLIGVDAPAPHGPPELRITSELLESGIADRMRPAESARLWHVMGATVPRVGIGATAEIGLIWWAARVGEQVGVEEALRAARGAVSRSWYGPGIAVLDAMAEDPGPTARVLRARAMLGLGRVREAVQDLGRLVRHSPGDTAPSSEWLDALRQGLLLARRLSLFQPAAADPLVQQLSAVLGPGTTPTLDRIVGTADDAVCPGDPEDVEGARRWLQEVRRIHQEAPCDEAAVAQLHVGARLGLGRHPDLGRLVLSLLLDQLAREGGRPDVEEAAHSLLLMITMVTGWHTDTLRLDVGTWRHGAANPATGAAVADTVGAVAAMQEDRMHTAAQFAVSAMASWERDDPYGLLPFASAVHAACASYVDPEVAAEAHRDLRLRGFEESAGFPALRLATAGMALVGSGPGAFEVADALVRLAERAREAGEWAQEQQLLLLGVLSGWPSAAEAIGESSWGRSTGRARMIGILGEAMITESDTRALEIADVLLQAGARFFGLAVLMVRWQRRHELDLSQRAWIVRTVLEARRRAPEGSWVLSTFTELDLSSREEQVLGLLRRGEPTRQVARVLRLSPRTVEATISQLLQRFSCRNRMELMELGLVDLE